MKSVVQSKVVTNAAWIIVCRIIQAVLNLVISMMTARYFGPSNYGLINYAAAVVAFFVPVMQLGLRSTLVQEYISKPDEEGLVLGTSTVLNILSAFLCIIGVAAFVSITNNNEKETLIVCVLYSAVLLFQATEMIQYWFQAKLLSKYTSLVSLSAYIVVSAYRIILLITEKSIYWFAVSNALDYLIISGCLFFLYKRLGTSRLSFSFDMAKKLLSRSKYYIVSSMMVTVFGYIGSIALEFFMNTEAVGYYTAAITSAGMTSFVFNALIDSARPMILSYKQTNEIKYKESIIGLYAVVFYVSLVQGVVICVFADIIVKILYGSAYVAAVQPLRVAAWYMIFSYLGPVRNIWILAEQKQKYLWIINLFGAIVSIMLNFVLIPVMGVLGAAVAALITQIFTNVFMSYFIKPLRENNKLLIKGLNPRNIYNVLKALINQYCKKRVN